MLTLTAGFSPTYGIKT